MRSSTSLSSALRPQVGALFCVSGQVTVDLDARVTAAEGARLLGVERHVIYMWRRNGKVQAQDKRYRLGDLLVAERDTRRNDPAGQRRARVA